MKSFRIPVKVNRIGFEISHSDKILSVGSCFSEHIGEKFADLKFDIVINPFGQQYNPHSIACGLDKLVSGYTYNEKDIFYHNELCHSFDFHSDFSSTDIGTTLSMMNESVAIASERVRHAKVLFVTLGSAFAFRYKQTGEVVSNCHKVSGTKFDSPLLKPEEIINDWRNTLSKLFELNNNLMVVFTVSPVRYLAYGAFENSVGKAHLFTAINELITLFDRCFYFPSYELVVDDLRDYRFYDADMLHPNSIAIEYVWESLAHAFFSDETLKLNNLINDFLSGLNHRPRNPQSMQHKAFLKSLIDKATHLQSAFQLDLSKEIDGLKKQI